MFKRRSIIRQSALSRLISLCLIATFVMTMVVTPRAAYAQSGVIGLPQPGAMVDLSPAYVPVLIKGLRVHPENPVLFDFIVDTGNSGFSSNSQELRIESEKLIKYFLATLTIPEEDMWVNLSPYEKDRIIPQQLGQTELGREMLAQDYMLKQLTASLIYPERDLGKEFWNRVYAKAQQLYGTSTIPVNTFNKVWILPDKAAVFVRNNTAFVVDSHLKVMLEADYLSLSKHTGIQHADNVKTNAIGNQIVREIVLPELEKEVNRGKNFATLRQMFSALVLASWYKKNLKEALLNQVYSNKSKISGVDVGDKTIKDQIYKEYMQAYKKGVFNYVKEDINQATKEVMPRKYFSGGLVWNENTATVGDAADPRVERTLATLAHDGADGNVAMVTAGVEKQTADNQLTVAKQMQRFVEAGTPAGQTPDPNALNAKKLVEKDVPGDEITAAPLVKYEEVSPTVNDRESIQNIVDGKVAYFKFAAGEAGRLWNSFVKAGIISQADKSNPEVVRQYRMWNLNLWDVADKVRENLPKLRKMKEDLETEQASSQSKDNTGEIDDLTVIINGFSQAGVVPGLDLRASNPEYATKMKLGVRHLMALKIGIIEEAAKIGVKPEDALKNVQLVLSVTNALAPDVIADLKNLAQQGVLGFRLQNIQLVVNDNIPGYTYVDGQWIENDLGPQNPNPNHGFNIIYANAPSKDGMFKYDEAKQDFVRVQESAFQNLENAKVETISIQRTNDMIMLVPETAVDIKTYGIYNKLHQEKGINQLGINQLIEVLNNFTGEKGGLALSTKKRALQGLMLLAEGLAVKTKEADAIIARVRKEFQDQGYKDIPYNRMYHYIDLQAMRGALRRNGGVLPMSVKNDKPVKGNWSPEIPTGDLTMLDGMRTKAFIRGHDFMIDNGILPTDAYYTKQNAGVGAEIHDFKQLKHLLVALGPANRMDAYAAEHQKLFPANKAMRTEGQPAAKQNVVEGGIDFNARNMQFNISGEEVKLRFNPAMVEQFRRGDFSGVRPVIISIVPIQNVKPLLGLKEEDESLVRV